MAKNTATKAGHKSNNSTVLPENKSLSADALPRRSLEKAVELAKKMREVYAASTVTFDELAKAMNLSKNNADFKYAVWSAVSYGIINAEGKSQNRRYSLAETGRR